MKHLVKIKSVSVGLLLSAISFCSQGALQINLDGDSTQSQLTVSLSGETIAFASFDGYSYLRSPGWGFEPMEFDPFPSEVTGLNYGVFEFTSGVGLLTNLTSGAVITISGIWLQDSSNSPFPGLERFGITTSPIGFQFDEGDIFQLSGGGVIDLMSRSLVVGDLSVGATPELCETGLCGQLIVGSVPEAPTSLMMSTGILILLLGAIGPNYNRH